ncbi:hypothetical protein BGW39_009115 [Mortierella sp. 14UC]|nr:hypothetical protein BGW39_009115 [Mortierella sp. 14UC]
MRMQVESDYPVIIGIDFGVKRSVVSFAIQKDGEVLDVYYNQRGICSRTMSMVSLYKRGSKDIVDWGDSALRTMMDLSAKDKVVLRDIRLQLDERLKVPPLEGKITPLKAITDYLRKLHENVVLELKGLQYTSASYQYWITVPVHWSDRAKDTMRQAAIGAGLVKMSDPPHRLTLISEDEAAAFRCARSTDKVQFRDKDQFMVCNVREAEGVTLTMLEVSETVAGQVRAFKEVARSHGTDNVPASIDANMRRLLEYKLRDHLSSMSADGLDKLMDRFRETVKPRFDGNDTQYLRVSIGIGLDHDDVLADLRAGNLVLSSSELTTKVFEPAAKGVLRLIRAMLRDKVPRGEYCKAIFMVGEFGASEYLSELAHQEFFLSQGALFFAPTNQDAVIASGAVHAGLASSLYDRTTAYSLHPPTCDSLSLSSAPRVPSAPRLSNFLLPHGPEFMPSTQTFAVSNNPYQEQGQGLQGQNGIYQGQYLQQGFPPQHGYYSQAFQQQHQSQLDTSGYGGINMNSVGAALPQIFVPQAVASSGMVTSAQGYIQEGRFTSGPTFEPIYSNADGSGSVYGPNAPGMPPTCSLYKKGSTEIQDWGHKALAELKKSPHSYYLLRNLRLQLDESIDVPPFENGITPLKAITDYLRGLHEYVLSELNKPFSEKYDSQHVQYCLTVPARWSNRAKSTMRQAAINAGLVQAWDPPSHLTLLSEDKAMATYCLQRRTDEVELKDKDRFMTCNAAEGGGVDVVVFEVSESAGQRRCLNEISRMRSEDCGSDFLNANMERVLELKLRKYRSMIPAHGWESFMDNFWDFVRPYFYTDNEDEVFLQVPGGFGLDSIDDRDVGLRDGLLYFTAKEVKEEVFEPAAEDILELIQDMLQKQQRLGGTCKALYMLGEFGSCKYMLGRAQQAFEDRIELVTAHNLKRRELSL